jgi:hypothetical protein
MSKFRDSGHTPGPWETAMMPTKCYGPMVYVKQAGSSQGITSAASPAACSEANARLIAAAPDLLADIESAVQLLTYDEDHNDDRDTLKANIDHVRGMLAERLKQFNP